jgi:hypothetical protein
MLSTCNVTVPDLNNELSVLDGSLQLKEGQRNFRHESRDPACKASFKWVTNTTHKMTRKKAVGRWENKISNCEVTSRAIWPIVNYLMKRVGPKVSTAIHGLSGPKFFPAEKVNDIADCLENQFMPYDLCDEHHERQVQLLAAEYNTHPRKESDLVRKKLLHSLKLRKAC